VYPQRCGQKGTVGRSLTTKKSEKKKDKSTKPGKSTKVISKTPKNAEFKRQKAAMRRRKTSVWNKNSWGKIKAKLYTASAEPASGAHPKGKEGK